MTGRDELAFFASERSVIDAEEHGDRRFIDADARQSDGIVDRRQSIANGDFFDTRDGEEFAGWSFFDAFAIEAVENVELTDFDRAISLLAHDREQFVFAQRAFEDAADGHFAQIIVVVGVGDEGL